MPLAAAAPVEAGYLQKWFYGRALFDTPPGNGTVQHSMTVSDAPGGSKLTGLAQYTLNDSAVARVDAGYSGLGAGLVDAGDRADFTWDFTLTDTGLSALTDVQWELYAVTSPQPFTMLASGSGFGTFSGDSSLHFSTTGGMNWWGTQLIITATAPGPDAGQYQFNVALNNDGIRYVYVPIPEPAMAGAVVMLSAMFTLRRRPRRN